MVIRRTIERIRGYMAQLVAEHASPLRIGIAVAVGVIVGLCPLYSLHTVIVLGLAYILRLNKVAAFLGSQISNPLFAAPLIYACVQVGNRLRTGTWWDVRFANFSLTDAKLLLLDWAVGGGVLGVLGGALLGLLIGWVVYQRRKHAPGLAQPPRIEP